MANELIGTREVFGIEFDLQHLTPYGPILAEVDYVDPDTVDNDTGGLSVPAPTEDLSGVRPYGGVLFWVGGHSFGDLEDAAFFQIILEYAQGSLSHAPTRTAPELSALEDEEAWQKLHTRRSFKILSTEGF